MVVVVAGGQIFFTALCNPNTGNKVDDDSNVTASCNITDFFSVGNDGNITALFNITVDNNDEIDVNFCSQSKYYFSAYKILLGDVEEIDKYLDDKFHAFLFILFTFLRCNH